MSHFAKLDSNNIVTEIIVSEKDFINSGAVGDEFLWAQTSYNNNFRGNYAGIGYTWDEVNKVFLSPKPHDSWLLDIGKPRQQCPMMVCFTLGTKAPQRGSKKKKVAHHE